MRTYVPTRLKVIEDKEIEKWLKKKK
jgi:hypothetical protein